MSPFKRKKKKKKKKKLFLEVKGETQNGIAPETLREKDLERRDRQQGQMLQQQQAENKPQNGHWCGGWESLSGL